MIYFHYMVIHNARLHCPLPTPRACSDSCPSSQWCYPTILSSVIPFSSHLQSFLASGSFPMNQFFATGGQSIGVSASALVLPMNIQDWFPLGWDSWSSLQSKGLSRVFSNTTVQKHQFFGAQLSLWFNSHIYTWLGCENHDHSQSHTGKTIALTKWTFVGKVMSLLFNMLFRLVIAFLPRSKRLLISWLQSPSAVILEPKKIKLCHCFHSVTPVSMWVSPFPSLRLCTCWLGPSLNALFFPNSSFHPFLIVCLSNYLSFLLGQNCPGWGYLLCSLRWLTYVYFECSVVSDFMRPHGL